MVFNPSGPLGTPGPTPKKQKKKDRRRQTRLLASWPPNQAVAIHRGSGSRGQFSEIPDTRLSSVRTSKPHRASSVWGIMMRKKPSIFACFLIRVFQKCLMSLLNLLFQFGIFRLELNIFGERSLSHH